MASRPEIVSSLFTELGRLKGVGPSFAKVLARLLQRGGMREAQVQPAIRDLLFHLPSDMIDRRESPPLSRARDGKIITTVVRVEQHIPPVRGRGSRGKSPYRVVCGNGSGTVTLVFFNPREEYLRASLPVGEQRVISGKVERFDGMLHMPHPDVIAPVAELTRIQALEPVYPLTYGITNRQLLRLMQQALAQLPSLSEWIDPQLVNLRRWPSWPAAIRKAHTPQKPEELLPTSPARQRLAYDEILANQLALALVRRRTRKQKARPVPGNDMLRDRLRAALPFALTQGQEAVIGEIDRDLVSGERMLRLLQGDVGSGKTIVALMAMLRVIENGRQCALMAPTEILARQHYATIQALVAPLGVRVGLVTGSLKTREKKQLLCGVEAGLVDITIGTHALIQGDVAFQDLALCVIDEQHRFGVAQRLTLSDKGSAAHILLMTATPIPRSLAMTAYGDMDVSSLTEKPVGRLPIATRAVPLARLGEVIDAVERAVAAGNKVYWVCPLIEVPVGEEDAGAKADLAAAQERFKTLQARFGERVGLVHGRMKPGAREEVMTRFAAVGHDILVATTVIEVGVNVPEATVMVIEHAERFGLAQLHQLRGRVGRGDVASSCILLYADRIGEVARTRLKTIRECDDGFRIAEEDLRLRGAGEMLGVRQSGLPEFQFADLALHGDLLATARDDVKLILHRDAALASPRGNMLRALLYLFRYDEQIRYVESG